MPHIYQLMEDDLLVCIRPNITIARFKQKLVQ